MEKRGSAIAWVFIFIIFLGLLVGVFFFTPDFDLGDFGDEDQQPSEEETTILSVAGYTTVGSTSGEDFSSLSCDRIIDLAQETEAESIEEISLYDRTLFFQHVATNTLVINGALFEFTLGEIKAIEFEDGLIIEVALLNSDPDICIRR